MGVMHQRRWVLGAVTASVLALVVSIGPGVVRPATAVTAPPAGPPLAIPPDGSLFGASASPQSGPAPGTLTSLEAALGRRVDVDRIYADWDQVEPDSQVVWDVDNGIIPVLSIKAITSVGRVVPWAQIAAGDDDAAIVAQAKGLASLRSPVILAFNHEPESDPSYGSPADFVAAWRHYVTVFRAEGATNVSFVLILEARSYDPATIDEWYPGDSYVDWVAADGYNRFGCDGSPPQWQDFSTLFSPLNSFAVAHDKPAMITEWGSAEDPAVPGRKAQWITDAAQTLIGWPQVKASMYFDNGGSKTQCNWPLTSSASALDAFRAMGQLPTFAPRPVAALDTTDGSGPAPLQVTFTTEGTTDALRAITAWSLNFGDGSPPATGSGAPPATIAHTYAAGQFTAVLTVSDGSGLPGTDSLSIQAFPTPTVTSGWATTPSPTSVSLNGTVDPNGMATTYRFEWGTTTSLGASSTPVAVGSGTRSVPVSDTVTGLPPGTSFYWALVASNGAGVASGVQKTVTTPGAPAGIGSIAASATSSTSVRLTGLVTPHRLDTRWYFVYGTTTAYGQSVPVTAGDAGSGISPVQVSVNLSGLAPGSSWHYTLVAVNLAGTRVSTDHTFRLPT